MVEPLPPEPHLPSSNMAPIDVVAPTPAADGGYENETALVLYNPMNTRMFKSPTSPDFSLVVNSDLIPGLKGMCHKLHTIIPGVKQYPIFILAPSLCVFFILFFRAK